MDDFEEKLNSILSNPQMMQQIMSMAQAFGQGSQSKQDEPKPEPPKLSAQPLGMDPAMLQRLMGIIRQSGIDKNQQNLLRALSPYLSRERIIKLERAMRSARIAAVAASMLRSSGIPLYSGR